MLKANQLASGNMHVSAGSVAGQSFLNGLWKPDGDNKLIVHATCLIEQYIAMAVLHPLQEYSLCPCSSHLSKDV